MIFFSQQVESKVHCTCIFCLHQPFPKSAVFFRLYFFHLSLITHHHFANGVMFAEGTVISQHILS